MAKSEQDEVNELKGMIGSSPKRMSDGPDGVAKPEQVPVNPSQAWLDAHPGAKFGYHPDEVAKGRAHKANDKGSKLKAVHLNDDHLEDGPEPESYRHEVHGIVPGYKGHMPRARDVVGTSTVGYVGFYDHTPQKRPYGQYHGNSPPPVDSVVHKPFTPAGSKLTHGPTNNKGVLPGYSGHVSMKRETYGASIYAVNGTYQ